MKYAFRVLLRHKVFVGLAATSLGVAISLCSIVFGLLDAMIHPTLAIQAPRDLKLAPYHTQRFAELVAGASMFNARLAAMKTLSGATASLREASQYASRGGETRETQVLRVSPNYFAVLGVPALHGRTLGPADAENGQRPVLLSQRMWAQWFPAATWSDTLSIVINGDPRPILGILAYEADLPGAGTDVWQLEPAAKPLPHTLIRKRPDVSEEAVYAEFKVVASQLAATFGDKPNSTYFILKPVIGKPFELLGFHYALIAGAVAVFLVACFNLANLQLARGVHRSRELATLSAIGATRRDLIVLMMQETAILAASGLALSIWLTVIGVKVMRAATPPKFGDFLVQPQVSWRVFAFSAVVALGAAFLVGLLPAIRLSRWDIHQALKLGEAKLNPHRDWGRALLVAQVGLALGVLVAASLLARTVMRIKAFDIGLPMDRLVAGYVFLKEDRADQRRVTDFKAQVLSAVRAEAGVADVAVSSTGEVVKWTLLAAIDGKPPREVWPYYNYLVVSSNYLSVLGQRIVAGRNFSEGETEQTAVIEKRTADFLWPGASAVGRQVKFGDIRSNAPWMRVIGVVADRPDLVRADLGEVPLPGMGTIYVSAGADTGHIMAPSTTGNSRAIQFTARSTSADATPPLRNQLERRMRASFPDFERVNVNSYAQQYEQYYGTLLSRQSFVAGIFATFGLIALLVAALGVYAAFSQIVALKSREYAIRIALGASSAEVRAFVMREANVLVMVGIAAGLIFAALNVEWLAAFVRSKADRYDSVAYGLVAVMVFVTAAFASYLPARRAVPADLMKALTRD